MKKKPITNRAGDARELTREDFRRAVPMRVADPELVARWKKWKRQRGRPTGRTKAVVSLSLDKDMVSTLRASGSGWQSRVNELLRAAIGLDRIKN